MMRESDGSGKPLFARIYWDEPTGRIKGPTYDSWHAGEWRKYPVTEEEAKACAAEWGAIFSKVATEACS